MVRASKPGADHGDVPSAEVRQSVVAMAEQSSGDYTLFGSLMQLSLELAVNGEFDQALWVADQTIAVARRLGARILNLAREAREQILELRAESEANR